MKARVGLRLLTAAAFFVAAAGVGETAHAGDPGNAYTLFQLTNQDRTSNGLGALGYSASLSSIATSARGGCGGVNGRSRDMIERNYFAHQIPPCGQYVWQVFNLGAFTAAGENIGWNNYPAGQSVNQINTAFMNSPEHKANILGGYNQMGTGAWAATGPWSGAGGPYNGVIMYTEIFINSPGGGGPPPPPPPPPSRPPPISRPPTGGGGTPPGGGGGTPPGGGSVPVPAPSQSATAAPSPSPSPIPTCPVATDIGEADRNSPAPTLAPDGGAAPCPIPNLVGPAPSAGPASASVTGSIDAGSDLLTVSAPGRIAVGDTVTIPGAGAAAGDLVAHVVSIRGKTITLDADASSGAKDAAVRVRAPAEVLGAEREASHRGILETVVDQVLRLFLNV
ncbi:MAG TPA: CAP domain-containing protein [Candidatus Dormibacteraeota bacterium]|nr:CAP domain-containing protein [Candidatus Dormibacteraeota bacterium]